MLIALLIMSYLLTTSCAYLGPVQRLYPLGSFYCVVFPLLSTIFSSHNKSAIQISISRFKIYRTYMLIRRICLLFPFLECAFFCYPSHLLFSYLAQRELTAWGPLAALNWSTPSVHPTTHRPLHVVLDAHQSSNTQSTQLLTRSKTNFKCLRPGPLNWNHFRGHIDNGLSDQQYDGGNVAAGDQCSLGVKNKSADHTTNIQRDRWTTWDELKFCAK